MVVDYQCQNILKNVPQVCKNEAAHQKQNKIIIIIKEKTTELPRTTVQAIFYKHEISATFVADISRHPEIHTKMNYPEKNIFNES